MQTLIAAFLLSQLAFWADVKVEPPRVEGSVAQWHACSAGQPLAEGGELPAQFVLTSWNAYKLTEPGWQEELSEFAGSSHLLLLQESELGQARRLLSEQRYWQQAIAFSRQQRQFGVLTASSVPMAPGCLSQIDEPLIEVPKTVLIHRFRLANGQPLTLLNLHNVNLSTDSAFEAQLQRLHQLLDGVPGALIAGGDFNSWNPNRQRQLSVWAASLGLLEVQFHRDQRSRFMGQPLDHLFYRGVEVEAADVRRSRSSDHHALQVTFSTPAAATAEAEQALQSEGFTGHFQEPL